MINNNELELALNSIFISLSNRRGAFYPNKDFGIKLDNKSTNDKELLALSRQACNDIDGVYIKSATIIGSEAHFDVLINGEKGQVTVKLE